MLSCFNLRLKKSFMSALIDVPEMMNDVNEAKEEESFERSRSQKSRVVKASTRRTKHR